MSIPPPLMRVRIHSLVTRSRFLHVEDSLAIGKIRLFAGSYRRGEGLDRHTAHYLSLPDARVVFDALARGEAPFSYREQKGKITDSGALSRGLTIEVMGERVVIELKSGPGKPTPTGAVTPSGPATVAVSVGCKRYDARRLGAAVLAYLRAWDVMRMLEHRDAIGQPGPYLVVPATSDGSENGHGVHHPELVDVGLEQTLPVDSSGEGGANGRPQSPEKAAAVARARRTSEALFGPDEGHPPQPASSLQYGDGTAVDRANSAEVQTFRQFLAEKRTAPMSRAILQAYYRQRTAVH